LAGGLIQVPQSVNVTQGFTQGMARSPLFGATSAPVVFGTSTNVLSPFLPGGQGGVSNIGLNGLLGPLTNLANSALILGAPGGASFNPNDVLGNIFSGRSNFASGDAARFSLNPSLQALMTQARTRVLSEPTLTTISGERAAFLAGGEIPILQSIATAGTAQQSVTFEPFGLRLNMIPVLLENGSINLEVAPEERIPSTNFQLNVPASNSLIPSFVTRKTQTIVEMKPGQELFISGLVTANSSRQLTRIPMLGDIPVLGALYRSKAFAKNESELVVSVRPEIILPGTPGQYAPTRTGDVQKLNKTEGYRDTNMIQVEPTILDERYMTSGKSDKLMKLPNEGAAITDN
jgi:Flp pilus assembly secretin CpaC